MGGGKTVVFAFVFVILAVSAASPEMTSAEVTSAERIRRADECNFSCFPHEHYKRRICIYATHDYPTICGSVKTACSSAAGGSHMKCDLAGNRCPIYVYWKPTGLCGSR